MQKFKVSELIPHPQNEFFFDEMEGQKWQEFLESIRTSGVIEPPVVTSEKVIVSGHQRIRACKELGIEETYCEVRTYDDPDRVVKDLLETNLCQRGTIGGCRVKTGRIAKELERIYGIGHGGDRKSNPQVADLKTQADIAKDIGVSTDNILRSKRLAELPVEYQTLLMEGKISPNTALTLVDKLSEEEQLALLAKLPSAQKFTQNQVQEYIDQIRGLTETNATLAQEAAEAVRTVKAGTDSAEYMRMQKRLKEEEEKSRKYYEDFQAEKKKNEEKPPKKNEIKEAIDKAKEDTKQQYRKIIERLEKEAEEAKKAAAPEPETIEVVPDDYEEIKAELARLKSSQSLKNVRSVKIDETEEQKAIEYYSYMQTCTGTFLAEMEGFTIQKDFCVALPSDKKAFMAENLRTIINRCSEIIDFIKDSTSKEAA